MIRAVDVRTFRKLENTEYKGDLEIQTYKIEHQRAVNVISIREDGLTEIRIQAYKNAIDYENAAEDMFNKAAGLIERIRFDFLSLARARLTLLQKRNQLGHIVRFADNEIRDREGNVMSLASGSRQQGLYLAGSASDKSMEAFLSVGTPTCDEVDCFWLVRANSDVPSTEVHTFIGGANNEVEFPAHCDRKDYEYALAQILNFTK